MAIKISGTTIINDSRNFVDTSGNTRLQLLTGGIDIEGGIAEQVSSTNPASGTISLNPANQGTFPFFTTSGAITFTDALTTGESMLVLLAVTNAAHTITWPASNWTWIGTGGSAPTLTVGGLDIVALAKHGTTMYAAFAGSNT